MSQKIIIPKGTIDSTHTTIIEIPTYLHDASTVVVTTPKTADPAVDENWAGDDYSTESGAEQNEVNWEVNFKNEIATRTNVSYRDIRLKGNSTLGRSQCSD